MAAAWTLITGANRGIGFQLALDLIARSDRPLIIAARSQARQPAELWPARPTSNRCVGAAA
jgi:NAD(P)-dependent dehydrogenase (short-subunit alcohol dehydrogenase family)